MHAAGTHRAILALIAALVIAATLTGGVAAADSSPDAIDRYLTNHTPAAATAPDALDRYLANTQTSRTPDMIGRLLTQTPSPTNSSAPQAAPATRTAPPLATTSFDWAAASIGAGTTLGLILLAAATVTAIRRRTRIAPLS